MSSGPAVVPDVDGTTRNGDFVQSLERGLAVLGRLLPGPPGAHAVRRSPPHRLDPGDRPPAAAHLRVARLHGHRRPPVRAHAQGARPRLRVPVVARHRRASRSRRWRRSPSEVHESVSVAVLDGDEIVYVARVPTKRIMTISLALGSRLPAVTTSMGRVLLADLAPDDARRLPRPGAATGPHRAHRSPTSGGCATSWPRCAGRASRSSTKSSRTACAPSQRRCATAGAALVAAINVSTHAGRVSLKELKATFLPALLSTAAEINARLAKR